MSEVDGSRPTDSSNSDPLDELLRPPPRASVADLARTWVAEGNWITLGWLVVGSALGVVLWAVFFHEPPEPVELPMVDAAQARSETKEQSVADSASSVNEASDHVEPTVGDDGSTRSSIFVHVAGHVNEPGVIEAPLGSRAGEIIEMAGGATGFADLNALNLARVLQDGERVYVPAIGEVATDPKTNGQPNSGDESPVASNEPVNINLANASELEALTGVGPKTAESIVEYREQNGPFGSVAELEDVSGIGPSKLASIEPDATVGP